MRFALSLVAVFCVSMCLPKVNGRVKAADDKADPPLKEAYRVCSSWARDRIKALEDRKITAESIQKDFELIERAVSDDMIRKFMAQHKANSFDKEGEKELIVAIWTAWRIQEVKGGLKSVLNDLDKFVKVRFKSDPEAAAVTISGIPWGKTPKQVALHPQGKYDLMMTKDGYMEWRKSQYTPPSSGETFDEKLKKKP